MLAQYAVGLSPAERNLALPTLAVPTVSPPTIDDVSFNALVESMSVPWTVPQPFLSPPIDGTFDFGNHLGPKGEQGTPLPTTLSLVDRVGHYSSIPGHLQGTQTVNPLFGSWTGTGTTTSPAGSSSAGSSTSALPMISPISTIGSLSPGTTQFTNWFDQGNEDVQPCHSDSGSVQNTHFEGSMLGLYESIMACTSHDSVPWNGFIPVHTNQPEREDTAQIPFPSEFPLRRRARSSFSSHRRAIQKSKSASMLRLSRERRETCPPPAIVIPAIAANCADDTFSPSTPGFKRASPLKHRASAFLDVDPATSGLKSPTKVLAYQARVRQQRSAMRAIIDDIKIGLQPLVETNNISLGTSTFVGELSKLVDSRPVGDSTCTPMGRSRASSRASEQSQHSRTSSCAGLAGFDPQSHADFASTHSMHGWAGNHILNMPQQSAALQGQPAASSLWPVQGSLDGCPQAVHHSELTEDKTRSRQKNAYKQRLRSEELNGIEFLSGLAKLVVTQAQQAPASERSALDQQAFLAIKTAVWKHRADWDLLLAAERRLGWGNPAKAKAEIASGSASAAQNEGSQDFGLLVPFFFLSYPSASS